MINTLRNKFILLTAISLFALALSGCGGGIGTISDLTGSSKAGTVIVYRAQIRSSYAVVAADLLEVKRGQTLDILEDTEFEKVRWFRVRAHDEDNTEGWIEAQNVVTGEQLDKSKKLAEEDKDLQPQASGQLRAVSNLRLAPDMAPENILYKLENGAVFDIMGWKYVAKAQDTVDVDDASKNGDNKQGTKRQKTKNAEVEAAKEGSQSQDLDENYDIWYKVRLDPSVSPAPSGWVFGRQVVLQVPSDIVFYQSLARKFVTWQKLDNLDTAEKVSLKDKDTAKVSKPGSWIILTRSNNVKAKDGREPDFDGILVLGYDKYNEEHYTVYRVENVWGEIPLKVEGSGDNRTFIVRLRSATGQIDEKRFGLIKDPKGRFRVNPPPDVFIDKSGK